MLGPKAEGWWCVLLVSGGGFERLFGKGLSAALGDWGEGPETRRRRVESSMVDFLDEIVRKGRAWRSSEYVVL